MCTWDRGEEVSPAPPFSLFGDKSGVGFIEVDLHGTIFFLAYHVF